MFAPSMQSAEHAGQAASRDTCDDEDSLPFAHVILAIKV